jgi:DinB family protein
MTHNMWNRTLQLLLITFGLAAVAVGQDLTESEREKALRYLVETRTGVADTVKGLSEAQWKFKPAPDRWSVAEVVEHLAVIEDLVKEILGKLGQAPAGAPDRDPKKIDAFLFAEIPDRSKKFQAPPEVSPTGRWAPADALKHFQDDRNQIAQVLQTKSDLRQHVINHPAFGPLDGYQWILAVAAHSARHTKQILEVKTDPHFPAK